MRCARPVGKIWRDEYGRIFVEGEAGDLNSSTSVESHLLFAVLTELRTLNANAAAPAAHPTPAAESPGMWNLVLSKVGLK